MQSITPILIGIAGLVIGYVIGSFLQKKNVAAGEERLKETVKKHENYKRESGEVIQAERKKSNDLEKKLTESSDKIVSLEQTKEQHKNQIKQLQGSLQETETARVKALANAETNSTARQQMENRYKQAETNAAELQEKLGRADTQLKSTLGELSVLKETLEKRDKELKAVQNELKASLKKAAENEPSSHNDAMEIFAEAEGSLEGILKILMESEGQKAAVLADANGIVVAAAGEKILKEGMAATSQLVKSISTQLVGMIPFSNIRAYVIKDSQANVLAGRAFNCAGETIGLATFGPRSPSDQIMDGAMANLSAVLE